MPCPHLTSLQTFIITIIIYYQIKDKHNEKYTHDEETNNNSLCLIYDNFSVRLHNVSTRTYIVYVCMVLYIHIMTILVQNLPSIPFTCLVLLYLCITSFFYRKKLTAFTRNEIWKNNIKKKMSITSS